MATAASAAAATLNGQPPITTLSAEPTETSFRVSHQIGSQPAEEAASRDLPCARYDRGCGGLGTSYSGIALMGE